MMVGPPSGNRDGEAEEARRVKGHGGGGLGPAKPALGEELRAACADQPWTYASVHGPPDRPAGHLEQGSRWRVGRAAVPGVHGPRLPIGDRCLPLAAGGVGAQRQGPSGRRERLAGRYR